VNAVLSASSAFEFGTLSLPLANDARYSATRGTSNALRLKKRLRRQKGDRSSEEKTVNKFDSVTKLVGCSTAFLLVALVVACGSDPAPATGQTKPAPITPGTGTGTGAGGHGPPPVILGKVTGPGTVVTSNFVMLAKTGISTTGTTAITGDLGVSPAAATYITGFALTLDAGGCFSTSSLVTGKVYAANYNIPASCPTPALLTAAVGDMMTAYTDAAGRAADFTEIGAGNIGGMTLPPGTYKWGTGVLIPTNVTLSGSANDVWIFQIAKGITQASGTKVILAGGAVARNVFWQAAGVVDLGTTAHMEGVILAQTQIAVKTGASVNGRLLAQSAITLEANTVVQPSP
jgi:hypothetical protein